MKTILECAKGSSLDISTDQDVPVPIITSLFPHTQQIRCLDFRQNYWEGMGKFSEANLGPLPLLRTLKINSFGTDENDQPITSPPPSFFADAINVEEFTFSSMGFQFHNHFNFLNLTTFSLWTHEVVRLKASDLFNFLKASPILWTVRINAYTGIMLEDIPQETVITLPNVETFELLCGSKNVYDVAARISCPRVRDVSLTCEVMDLDMPPVWEIFPTPVPWNKIVHQHTLWDLAAVIVTTDHHLWRVSRTKRG